MAGLEIPISWWPRYIDLPQLFKNYGRKQLVELVCYRKGRQTEVLDMLWTIFVILLVLWLLGFSFHVAGGLLHLLLVIAVIVLIIYLLSGRSTAV